MSQGQSHHSHGTHTASDSVGHELRHAAAEEHKAMRAAHRVDSSIYMAEALASGNPKRIERYFLRRLAYKLFGRFMAKTINRI
jgi:hypothetical protein